MIGIPYPPHQGVPVQNIILAFDQKEPNLIFESFLDCILK